MKRLFFGVVLTLIALLFVACGGGSDHGSTQPPVNPGVEKAQAVNGLPGMRVFAAKRTTTFNWSLVPRAYAQMQTTIALSQSWTGSCDQSPDGQMQTISGLLYRLGQNTSLTCANQWFFDNDGSGAAANSQAGQLVVGNGVLSNLVAWFSPGSNIIQGTLIHLWVLRNGQVLDTGIACTLTTGSGYQKCQNTSTYQVLDGDFVVATFAKPSTDD